MTLRIFTSGAFFPRGRDAARDEAQARIFERELATLIAKQETAA